MTMQEGITINKSLIKSCLLPVFWGKLFRNQRLCSCLCWLCHVN